MPRTIDFDTIPYPSVGESYTSPSRPVSTQRTLNLYPEVVKGSTGLTQTALHNYPGLKPFAAGAGGEFDRGMHVFNSKLYQVAGGEFYLISASGVRTSFGSILGTNQVSMADNGVTLVIVTGAGEYTFDGSVLTGPISISGANTPTNVEFINRQFIYDGNDGSFGVSGVGLTTVPAGNYGIPSYTLIRSYVFNQNLYLFGSETIEPWQNTGGGQPPFARINQGIIEDTGISGRQAVSHTEKAMYFVSSKGDAKQLRGFQTETISSVAVANEWLSYTLADAIVQTFKFQSLDFVVFSFPTNNRTWCYVEQYDFWLELSDGVNDDRWLGNSIRRAYNKIFVADYSSGNMYELDKDTFTNNGNVVMRERVFTSLGGEKFGSPRQRYQMSKLRLGVETGIGNAAEPNPQLMISYSTDGGRSYGGEIFKDLGQDGEYNEISTDSNRHFKDLAVRVRITEPTKFALFSASLDIRKAGR